MVVFITGASGFVGQNLSKHLTSQGYEIQSLSLRNDNWESSLDRKAKAIIHLAGKAHDTKSTSQSSEYFNINTALTKQLFDVFLKSEIKDFIYFSSVKAVADTVENVLFENEMPNPKTPYGQSKHKAEQYILSQEIPYNKRVFIIRPCMIHGPGNKGNLNLLFNMVKKGIPYPLAAYDNQRSFLSIDNLNFLILKILESKNIASGIYNFADDDFVATNQLVSIISKTINKQSTLVSVPKAIIFFFTKLGDVLKLPLNSENLKKMTENYRVSNKKIKEALQLEKLPVSSEDGLKKTIKSFIN
jgi:nucleoside-diphosphate-sugar epimerase